MNGALRQVREMKAKMRSVKREVTAEILDEHDGMYKIRVGGIVWGGISDDDLDFVLTGGGKL